MSTLYLFADTNLFLHYKPLSEIDWLEHGDFGQFDQIEIVVCRTVQREIDHLKDGRDSRRTQRARKTASEFLEIAQHGPQEQKPTSPHVILRLYDATQPKQDLAGSLDFNQNDDQIIGYLARFRADNPEAEARLLTRDSGPILTSRNLNIPYEIPDENWILSPETDDRDRKIQELDKQVAELKSQEPRFQIQCDGQESNRPGYAKVHYNVFRPLEPAEQDQLLRQLQVLHPPTVAYHAGVPVSAIKEYEEKNHPEWIVKCREVMAEFHTDIQQDHFPEITFEIENIGSRPATNARIDIEVKGNFGITRPVSELKKYALFRRKLPPTPPAQPKPIRQDFLSLGRGFPDSGFPSFPMHNLAPPPHDKEAFYYHNMPKDPTSQRSISLTCDLWRHAVGPGAFTVRVVPSATDNAVTGEVICTVHADNLTKPAMFKLVLTLSPDHQSALPLARQWFASKTSRNES